MATGCSKGNSDYRKGKRKFMMSVGNSLNRLSGKAVKSPFLEDFKIYLYKTLTLKVPALSRGLDENLQGFLPNLSQPYDSKCKEL